MENKFKWCFIGTGMLAKQVAQQIVRSGHHEIVSVYTRRFEKGQKFAEKFGGTAYESAEQAITADGVQGVYIVTPHNTHFQYAKQALELGKPVLCEKAFTTDAAQAEELITLAKEKNLYLAEAMWTWFSPVANQVKAWVDGGECGEILDIIANYHMDLRRFVPRLTDPKLAGGALLDTGVYPITYLYRLFGNPVKVVCSGVLDGGVDLSEEIDLTFRDGTVRRASVSIRDFKGFEDLRITGTKGTIFAKGFHYTKKVQLKKASGKKITFKGDTSYLNEFDIVAEEIRSGRTESACVPLSQTLDVMKIMDECRKQMGLVYPFEK